MEILNLKRAAVALQIHTTKREKLYGRETCEKFTDALSVKILPFSLTSFSLRFSHKLATCVS
jgi:hypothetical protein